MNKEYVQQYIKLENEHWWFVVRQKIILQILHGHLKENSLKILNIGAAGGASSKWLSAFGKVISVETESLFIDHLRKEGLEVINASVTALPLESDQFDLVCAFDVLEHVKDDQLALKEILRMAKSGATICITVPAFKCLWSEHDIVNGHERRYTKKSMHKLTGFSKENKEIELRYFNSLLFLPIWIARKIAGIFSTDKTKNESDFARFKTSGLSNKILEKIFSVELALLKFMQFPVGVSLIAVWKKQGSDSKA